MNIPKRRILSLVFTVLCFKKSLLIRFSTHLENVIMCPEPLFIAGNFNFHLNLVHSNNSRRFKELLQTFGLSQDVTASTQS